MIAAVSHILLHLCIASPKRWYNVPSRGIARITLADLGRKKKYAAGGIPFVLTDAVPAWNASRDWSVEWFAEHFGEEIVDYYPNNLHHVGHPWLKKMHYALDDVFGSRRAERRERAAERVAEDGDDGAAYAYVQWRVHLDAWAALRPTLAPLPAFFKKDLGWMEECLPLRNAARGEALSPDDAWPVDNLVRHSQWMLIVLGEAGSGMFIHPDGLGTGVWQAHVVGRKRWILCEPASRSNLYAPGEVDAMAPVDTTRFPRFPRAKCNSVIVNPGELLYYPGSWWHQTKCLDTPTIGFARRTVSRRNYGEVYTWFKEACDFPRDDIRAEFPGASPPLAQSVCQSLAMCKELWSRMYAKNATGLPPRRARAEL